MFLNLRCSFGLSRSLGSLTYTTTQYYSTELKLQQVRSLLLFKKNTPFKVFSSKIYLKLETFIFFFKEQRKFWLGEDSNQWP